MSTIHKLLAGLIVALLLSACGSTPDRPPAAPGDPAPAIVGDPEEVPEQDLLDPNRIVARVNDRVITVRSILAEIGPAVETIDPENKAAIRRLLNMGAREIIVDRLEEEAAERMGLRVTKEDIEQIAEATDREIRRKRGDTLEQDLRARGIPRWEWDEDQRRRLLRRRFMSVALGYAQTGRPDMRARKDIFIGPEEVRARYDRNREAFRVPETARVGAIFVANYRFEGEGVTAEEARKSARSFASEIVGRARRGESFAKLMAEHQKEPILSEPFGRGEQRDYVEEFVWRARVGQISDPIPTPSGCLVLKLLELQRERVLPFAEVKARISGELRELKQSEAVLGVRGDLLRAAVITPRHYQQELKAMFAEETASVVEELAK